MKKQNLLLALLFGMFVVFQSCEKKDLIDTENGIIKDEVVNADKNLQTAENIIYFLDDKEVSKNVVDAYRNSKDFYYTIQTDKRDEKTSNLITFIYIYSTEDGYIQYGIDHNINIKGQQDFVKKMHEYAEKTNALEYFNKYGEFSEDYKQYEQKCYNEIFKGNDNKCANYSMCDELNGNGDSMWLHSVWSFIPLVNNDIESLVCKLGARYNVTFFDYPGYTGLTYLVHGKKKFTRYKTVNFASYFQNRASSVINFF